MDLYQPAERSDEGLTTGQLAIEKFAIGQAVPRVEDPMLLRGHGRYTDDVSLPGQAFAVMVRSRNGHVPVEKKRQPTEHSLLGDPGLVGEQGPDANG